MKLANRSRPGELGAVGKMIAVWLIVVAIVGVALIDAGSITFTKFRLSDTASAAATAAANNYRQSHDHDQACTAAAEVVATQGEGAKFTNQGCVVNLTTGAVTITLRKEAKTILAAHVSFTKPYTKVKASETNGPTTL
jgi:Flp pilus assembly protein TadG